MSESRGEVLRLVIPRILGLVCLGLIAMVTLAGDAVAQSARFSRIDVVGNQRIEADTIRVFAGVEPGETVSPADINEGVQRLFDTGLFEDVVIAPRSGVLVITVVENPTINIINFEGNRQLDDDTLRAIISLQPRRAYSRAGAEADAQAIIDAYAQSGRFAASVTPKLIRLDENRVNLVYEIFEGRVTEVQRISFVGNNVYSDRRLRRVVETGQAGILSFIFSNDTYDQDRLELDKQLLREFYLNRGYIDFEVRSATAELSRERNGFFINFTVSEGEQYSYGDTFVTTQAPGLDPAEFEQLVKLRSGSTYSAKEVETTIERLAFLAGQKGFAFVEVAPRITRNEATRTVDIEFELLEGPRVFIERIDVRGNTQTVDRVVRRQFRVVEGDAFNRREVQRAENRIRALRFFDKVETTVREGSGPDRAVVVVDVEEAPTGSLSFGATFAQEEGVAGTISLTERNFLGRGQAISIDLARGEDINTISFSFNEPALFDQDLSVGFRTYYRENTFDESSVNTRNVGFVPQISFPLTEDSRLALRARISLDEITGGDTDDTSPILLREEGDELTTSIGFVYTLDKRNSPIDPTAGFIFRLEQDIAGLADTSYSKTVASAQVYTSLFDEEVVLSAEAEGGVLVGFDDESRLSDRFVLGGDDFRGFARGGLGPRDRCTGCGSAGGDIDDALGGNMFAVARLEASFPIGFPEEYGIYGGLFADVGTVWGLYDRDGVSGTIDDGAKLRSSIGASIFWDSALGPLRFNYAVPINSEDGDEFERFRLTIDTRF
ncbi:outer membrane protein assembly factor BamA [Algicella marina]|uniref:Outer membrane protein assembly factor BamA n=1 Tax=Algicella marina TaxID=2683284 RepID=A0A6P1SY88_9RHOB|nr:outer membrane protein assembly factor BamA [Algicella marina]QHQ34717.1 outer membrane protein assembly factor BamA [Algicella marina]